MNKKERLQAINTRLAEIKTKLETEADAKAIEALGTETSSLVEERGRIAGEMAAEARAVMENATEVITPEAKDVIESRSADLRAGKRIKISAAEFRSVLVSQASLAKPVNVGGINDNWDKIPSILNDVRRENLKGCSEYQIAFEKTNSAAAKGTDGSAATSSEPTFGVAKIKPYAVNCVSYVSKHIAEQTPVNYYGKVVESAGYAIRRKLANLIVAGDTTDFYGILTAVDKDGASLTQAVSIAAIDQNSLRSIVLGSYGGDDQVPGGCTLYLNKTNLAAFGAVRGTNEKKAIYEITPDSANPNTGVIKEGGTAVRYVIVSTLADNTLIYGNPLCYELGFFEDVTIEVSKDEKFSQGLISVLAETNAGGNVNCLNGFAVITIGA